MMADLASTTRWNKINWSIEGTVYPRQAYKLSTMSLSDDYVTLKLLQAVVSEHCLIPVRMTMRWRIQPRPIKERRRVLSARLIGRWTWRQIRNSAVDFFRYRGFSLPGQSLPGAEVPVEPCNFRSLEYSFCVGPGKYIWSRFVSGIRSLCYLCLQTIGVYRFERCTMHFHYSTQYVSVACSDVATLCLPIAALFCRCRMIVMVLAHNLHRMVYLSLVLLCLFRGMTMASLSRWVNSGWFWLIEHQNIYLTQLLWENLQRQSTMRLYSRRDGRVLQRASVLSKSVSDYRRPTSKSIQNANEGFTSHYLYLSHNKLIT